MLDNNEIEKIKELHRQGFSDGQIADELELWVSQIYYYREKLGLKINKAIPNIEKKCIICNKIFRCSNPIKKYCSIECAKKAPRAKRRKFNKIGDAEKFTGYCKVCGSLFESYRRDKIYCSKKCQRKASNKKRAATKKEIIADMRYHFNLLKGTNSTKAQKIADEMELLEGEEFRDLALNGLAPFRNPRKYDKTPYLR